MEVVGFYYSSSFAFQRSLSFQDFIITGLARNGVQSHAYVPTHAILSKLCVFKSDVQFVQSKIARAKIYLCLFS